MIAVAIAGMVCIVFMGLAADIVMEMEQLERFDQLTAKANFTAERVNVILDQYNSDPSSTIFPASPNVNECYQVQGTLQDPSLLQSGSVFVSCSYGAGGDPHTCRDSGNFNFTGETYELYCVDDYDSENGLVQGVAISGYFRCPIERDLSSCTYEILVIGRKNH
ncbi:hypothetical protein GF357_02290 [Candidatus Dojkabacteria bacterium]|nr:hypothetical protein [Candidatus Dojkabacteria bacterium]